MASGVVLMPWPPAPLVRSLGESARRFHSCIPIADLCARISGSTLGPYSARAIDGETLRDQPSANHNPSYHSWVNVAMVREGSGGLKRERELAAWSDDSRVPPTGI